MYDNTTVLYFIGILIFALGSLIINYGSLVVVITRWSHKPKVKRGSKAVITPTISFSETLLCYLPFYHVCKLRKVLYKKNVGTVVFMTLSAVLLLLRLLAVFIIPGNELFQFITVIGIYAGILVGYLTVGFVTADCAKMYGYSWLVVILSFLLPHFTCWFLRMGIPVKMKAMYKEEIFDEHKGEIVTRTKSNKR